MLKTNGCFVSLVNFITDTNKRPTTKLFIPTGEREILKEHKKLALLNIHSHFNRMHHLCFHKLSAQNNIVQIQSYYD